MPATRLFPGRLPIAAALTALGAMTAVSVSGCGSDGGALLPSGLNSAVSSLASQAASAASSALGAVKDGVDATSDVKAAATSTDSSGRTESVLTVSNPTPDRHDYTVSVAFDDAGGNLLDAVVVSIPAVAAHGSATATAISNRSLSGDVTAKVTVALRH